MITNQTMTVSITCSGNFNCIGHCYAWDWGDFVSNCSMGLFRTGDWIKVRHNVDSFSSITRPTERRSVTSCDVTLPSFLTEMAISIVERWRKVWPTVLFPSVIVYRKAIHVTFIFSFRFFCRICRIMFCWDPKIILVQQQRDVSLFKKKRTTKPLQFNDLYTKLANSIPVVTNPYTNNLWVWAMYSLTFFRHSSQCLFGHCCW